MTAAVAMRNSNRHMMLICKAGYLFMLIGISPSYSFAQVELLWRSAVLLGHEVAKLARLNIVPVRVSIFAVDPFQPLNGLGTRNQ